MPNISQLIEKYGVSRTLMYATLEELKSEIPNFEEQHVQKKGKSKHISQHGIVLIEQKLFPEGFKGIKHSAKTQESAVSHENEKIEEIYKQTIDRLERDIEDWKSRYDVLQDKHNELSEQQSSVNIQLLTMAKNEQEKTSLEQHYKDQYEKSLPKTFGEKLKFLFSTVKK